jgi:hypothetical protein
MALTTVTLHGQILELDGLTPAVGTVTFKTLVELNDTVDNVTYQPSTFVATLDVNGEFTIVLPATDNPDVVPLNWVYQAFVSTTTWQETIYFQLPFVLGTVEFADLTRLDYDPCTQTVGGIPEPPDNPNLYVLKAGDTMTGPLIINSSLQVNGTAGVTYGNTSLNIGQVLAMNASTCVLSGGELIPNADLTKIDISAMTGVIIDWDSVNPTTGTNPNLTYVTWPGVVGLVPTFAPITWYMINSAGALVQQAAQPTPAQRRQNAVLGLTLTQGGVILVDQTLPTIPSQVGNQLADLMDSLGPFIDAGCVMTPNGVNRSINLSLGDTFSRAFSQVPDYEDPHNAVISAQTPIQFRHITRVTGSAGLLTNLLNVGFYDLGGVVTPVGGGANTSTNFRVWGFANNTVTEQILIQYGQNTYASLAAAVAGIGSGNYIVQPATSLGALIGWITVTRTATNLSDPTQAVFTKSPKFPIP